MSDFGGWIASLSRDTAIEGAVVVVDSAQESIAPLIAKIDSEVSPDAPAAAQRQLREGARALSGTYADVEVFASVVWNVNELADTIEDAAADIAAKLPNHREKLAAAGAGRTRRRHEQRARPCRAGRVPAGPGTGVRAPTTSTGLPFRMTVTQAGPDEFHDDQRRICYHDGVASMTAMMVAPPQMHITEELMNVLFRPNGKFLRKRTAVFYRPLSQGKAFKAAKKVGANARRNSTTATGADDEFAKLRQELAQKTQMDLMSGAAMSAFAIEVTVTFEPTQRRPSGRPPRS